MDPDEPNWLTLATLTDAGMAKLVASAPGHVAEVRRLVVDVLAPEQSQRRARRPALRRRLDV